MRINKVLLVNPNGSVPVGSIRRLPTPLGLMYLAGVLEEHGLSVSILDCALEGYDNVTVDEHSETYGLDDEQIMARVREENPDLVGITCLFSKYESEARRLCTLVKHNISKDIVMVLGGIHPTYFADKMMRNCPDIDHIVQYEGEYKLLCLVEMLNGSRNLTDVDGCGNIANLDKIPFPARHLVDMEKYIRIGLFGNPFPKRMRMAQVLTSRGCPYSCNFCSTKPYWGDVRCRSAENIFEEIVFLRETYNIHEIQFRDDNLTAKRDNILRLFRMMKGMDMSWCAGISMVELDKELIVAMAESGCYRLTLSPESGSERVLKEIIHKPLRIEWVKPTITLAHKYGIDIHCDFVVGFPGETREEMYETFTFGEKIGADSCAFFLASPFPGSPLYKQCVDKGWVKEGEYAIDFKTPSINIPKDAPEYVMSHEEMNQLIEDETVKFNKRAKERNPKKWEEKYRVFRAKQSNQEDKVMGRVV